MVDKALVAGVAMLVGISAPTSLAIDHARAHGLTLEEVGYPPDAELAARARTSRAVRTLPGE